MWIIIAIIFSLCSFWSSGGQFQYLLPICVNTHYEKRLLFFFGDWLKDYREPWTELEVVFLRHRVSETNVINGQSFEFILFLINLDLDMEQKGAINQFWSLEWLDQTEKPKIEKNASLQSLIMFFGKKWCGWKSWRIDTTYARQIISLYLRFT